MNDNKDIKDDLDIFDDDINEDILFGLEDDDEEELGAEMNMFDDFDE